MWIRVKEMIPEGVTKQLLPRLQVKSTVIPQAKKIAPGSAAVFAVGALLGLQKQVPPRAN